MTGSVFKNGMNSRRLNRKLLGLMVIFAAFMSAAWLDPYRDEVDRGNENYHEKKYHAARNFYKRAEKYAPGEEDKKELAFNRGDADYKLRQYRSAIANYEKSLKSSDKDIQKKAFFNLGNTYVKMGKYKEAVAAYINALKIDPGYEKAKKNIEYLLKVQDKKKKKQKGKDGGGRGQNKDPRKDKNNKNRNKQGTTPPRLNKTQLKNLLEAMKKSRVRRQKGKGDNERYLEKNW